MSCRSFLWMFGACVLGGCGGEENTNTGAVPVIDAASCTETSVTGRSNCTPELSACWKPAYKPPKANPTACTEAQLLDEKSKCYGADLDPSCGPFERDPANAACLQCLFSTADEPSYGALILLPNGGLQSNIAGCLALVDGDTSADGCASRYQAYYQCLDAACMQNCSAYADYKSCSTVAATGVCAPYLRAAACRLKPIYAICTKYETFDEYFFAIGGAFCVQPVDAGAQADALPPQ